MREWVKFIAEACYYCILFTIAGAIMMVGAIALLGWWLS